MARVVMIPFSKVGAYLFSNLGYQWYVVTIHISAIVYRRWSKDSKNIVVLEIGTTLFKPGFTYRVQC